MKSVLISIQPKWCEKICNGEKTIEVRKTAPKCEVPFKCYIYETKGETETPWVDEDGHFIYKGRGQVVGGFVCDKVDKFNLPYPAYFNEVPQEVKDLIKSACMTMTETHHYLGQKAGYGWHISDLKIYDKPKELNEFSRPCSYAGLCFSCDRTKFTNKGDRVCEALITRPPQSWQYLY